MSTHFFKKSLLALAIASSSSLAAAGINVTHLSTFKETIGSCADAGAESCTEIAAYSRKGHRIYVTNAEENGLRMLDVNPAKGKMKEYGFIDLSVYGGGPNSVAIYNNRVAVAVEAKTKQDPGAVILFDIDGNHLKTITVGALPDMVTFTPDGKYLLVANEGEPNDEYTIDPEGSISIIDTATWTVKTADFSAFNGQEAAPEKTFTGAVRIFGPNATEAQDLEPEYIAVSADSKTAFVALQENNAFAILDIENAEITEVVGLGFKNHNLVENALDASNKDDAINITTWPVKGMYQPDAIASFSSGESTYIISANEGDSRDYDGYSEEERVKDLNLDPVQFPDAATLQENGNLGRLKTTTANGDTDGDGDYDEIYSYGARSYSIWNASGSLVWDSGKSIAETLVAYRAEEFNSQAEFDNGKWVYEFDNRSDDKGAEPESVTVGKLSDKQFAFIGLERTGGIIVADVTNPLSPTNELYLNSSQVDVGPEGLQFISKSDSKGWLMVTSEISNTVSLYEVTYSE